LEIPDPKRIQVATAENLEEKGDTTSGIAKRNNAVAAINAGGFYDANGTGTGRSPYGFIMHAGKFLLGNDSDDSEINEFIGFNKDGNLLAGNYSKGELKSMGVQEGISFGPALVVNGKKMITSGDGGWGVGPRTAIGQRKDGTVLFLVIDGRQPGYSIGATLRDLQNIMYEQGAYVAANLDGGSSSTLFLNGEVVNKPADLLGERMIPTAFIVK
jgi:exopolysaccharide biosynthesis protein